MDFSTEHLEAYLQQYPHEQTIINAFQVYLYSHRHPLVFKSAWILHPSTNHLLLEQSAQPLWDIPHMPMKFNSLDNHLEDIQAPTWPVTLEHMHPLLFHCDIRYLPKQPHYSFHLGLIYQAANSNLPINARWHTPAELITQPQQYNPALRLATTKWQHLDAYTRESLFAH